MQKNREIVQRSESFPIGVLLALTGGFLDAYTYVSRGGVFANAQTGNMVLLGIRLSEGAVAAGGLLFCAHCGICCRCIAG